MDPSEIRFIVYNIEILKFKKIRILPKEVGGGRGTKIKGGVIIFQKTDSSSDFLDKVHFL